MDTESLEATARHLARHRARNELRQAWRCAVELTMLDPQQGRWWAQRGALAAAVGYDEDMLGAMRQATYLFRHTNAPGRADAIALWLSRRGVALSEARAPHGTARRAWRKLS